MTAGLLALSLVAAAQPAPVGLQKGDEITFSGTVAEVVQRAPDFFRRNHKLELRVFVLGRTEKWADAVVYTRLLRTADAVAGAVGAVTGADGDRDSPPLVRLDLVRVHADGTAHLLLPAGATPLKLNADTPTRGLPLVPLEAFAPSEFGVFPPRVPRDGETWTLAAAGNRPAETWQEGESQFVHAERCRLLVMNQMSPNWEKPVGGQTAWHRADAVWVSTQDGTARRVHRVIKQRDGRDEKPAAWVEVKYELQDRTRLSGRSFDRARRDAEVAYAALAEATQLVPQAAKLGPKVFETRVANLDAHLEGMDATSPYREALLAARRSFDDARHGKVAPVNPAGLAVPATVPARGVWPEADQLAPDFQAGTFRLAEHRGKPVVLVFVRPGGQTTDLALAVADALAKRYAGKAAVATLVVFGELASAEKARDRLKFSIPLYDGAAVATAYGVETAPRFAVIDAAGKVRWVFSGVGAETGFLVKEQVDRLVAPASPTGAGGTTTPAGPPAPGPLPKQ